jgi:predicted ribosomally synthesized peptide with nif11-like leader
MSWAELERFVEDAETEADLREVVQSCQSQAELLLAARRRGYHITRVDFLRAWQQHKALATRQASGS